MLKSKLFQIVVTSFLNIHIYVKKLTGREFTERDTMDRVIKRHTISAKDN